MTALDDRLVPLAFDLVDRFGKSVTFTVPQTTAVRDEKYGAPVYSVDPMTYVKKVAPPEAVEAQLDPGTVQTNQCKILLPAQGLEFEPDQRVTVLIDGKKWRIVKPETLYSGESIAAYVLTLER